LGDACSLSRRWLLEPIIARALVETEAVAQRSFAAQGIRWPGIFIISGHRTAAQQKEANPSNPVSHHRCCPSLAVDLRVGDLPASTTPTPFFEFIARAMEVYGIKWGGSFQDPFEGFFERNHYYLDQPKCNN